MMKSKLTLELYNTTYITLKAKRSQFFKSFSNISISFLTKKLQEFIKKYFLISINHTSGNFFLKNPTINKN